MNAIILVRGKESERLRKDKSMLVISRDKTLLDIVIDRISGLFAKILIVTTNPQKFHLYSDEKIEIIRDDLVCGPLGGILKGLQFSSTFYNFIVATDMPFISKDLILFLVKKAFSDYDAVVPKHKNSTEVLHAIYSKQAIPIIEKMIEEKQYRVKMLLQKIKVKYVTECELRKFGDPEVLFFNINTPMDFETAKVIGRELSYF
ncbi:MAG: molybdenum cofactor guanylyltransferase [bacterium]|nr:molybdenum cofactor guanylyltransferase [bacterium]